ncbi:MAG: nSTAND1 domain-containing NTPase [Methylobacter sp.]
MYRKTAQVLVSLSDPALKADKERQKAMLDDFLEQKLGSADAYFKAGFNSFADAEEFERLFAQHLESVLQQRCPQYQKESANLAAWALESSPYRGLSYFDLEHAPVFYGRDRAIHTLLAQLQAQAEAGRAFVRSYWCSGPAARASRRCCGPGCCMSCT